MKIKNPKLFKQIFGKSKGNIVAFLWNEGGMVRLYHMDTEYSYLTSKSNFNQYYSPYDKPYKKKKKRKKIRRKIEIKNEKRR